MKIATLKNHMRFTQNPFSGDGYPFKQAIKELRAEGVSIVYNANKCHYYNKETVNPKWEY